MEGKGKERKSNDRMKMGVERSIRKKVEGIREENGGR